MLESVRCREWSPLATQQLRIRSLLQIVGYNIYNREHSDNPSGYYYTLHLTAMSAPIYTSEKLLSNHPKWKEIDSEIIHKMSSPSVVVRIWQHIHRNTGDRSTDEADHSNDLIVQTWTVNFSGLLHIGANLTLNFTPNNFCHNTLIFHMIGGYFCAYDSLKLEYSRNLDMTRKEADKKSASPAKQIPIDRRKSKSGYINESKSLSPGRSNNKYEDKNAIANISPSSMTNYSIFNKSSSPRSVPNFGRSIPENVELGIHEYSGSDEGIQSSLSYKSSSTSLKDMDVDESETAEMFLHDNETLPKCRYISMKFLKSEVRPSYTAKKLKELHFLQYLIKIRTQSVRDIRNEIYEKSAMVDSGHLSLQTSLSNSDESFQFEKNMSSRRNSFINGRNSYRQEFCPTTISDSKIVIDSSDLKPETKLENSNKRKSATLSINNKTGPQQGLNQIADSIQLSDTRFTIPLNKLLDFKTQPSPLDRLRFAQLTKAVEFGRFKRRLLQDEYDRARANLRKKREILSKLFEENQDTGTDLMQKFHSLSRKSEQLRELKKSEAALCELCARSASLLYQRRWELVQDIQLIFPITEDEKGRICILGSHLPACKDNDDSLEQCGEAALAITLGRVAHATALAATILATPLRYPLKLMGSRTKVLDHISSHNNNEIPLFARNKDSMMFRYGLFLLNTNIAQLLWVIHKHFTPDPRDTLSNLKKLLTPPAVSPCFDASKMFGSSSSVETVGPGFGLRNYCLTHPGSAPTLPVNIPVSIPGASSLPRLSNTPQSLRSLVAVGGGTSRQFNRFKDAVDGQSLSNALVSKRHRYSRSVGSYTEEKLLQNLEIDQNVANQDSSDSQIENKQNVLSLSESDLTKVSDILSPETSSVHEISPKGEEKVVFSLGDDSNTPESAEPIIDENPHQSYMKDIERQLSIPQDGDTISETAAIKLEHSDEKCQISNKNDCTEECDSSLRKLQYSDSFNSTSDESSLKEECSSNCLEVVEATNQILESIHKLELDKQMLKTDNVGNICDQTCPMAEENVICDIEKLDFPPYCTYPCASNYPKLSADAQMRLHPGYDHCENGTEVMQDVIVLPSAEAVMTCSSHFTNTEELMNSTESYNTEISTLTKHEDKEHSAKEGQLEPE